MFLICNGYVIGMSSHTFDITYTYQKHTQNFVWVSTFGRSGDRDEHAGSADGNPVGAREYA